MTRIRIKICGFTRPQDLREAAALGIDAAGLIFFAGSKRHVDADTAAAIVRAAPPFVSTVGLFVNEQADTVRHVLERVPLDMLQFHGDEPPEYCRQFGRPYLKAIRVRSRDDIIHAAAAYTDARALLLDAYSAEGYGGTGHTFDWQLLPENLPLPWILSGGLNSGNLAQALRQTRAATIDVSSGSEHAPGIKSMDKIAELAAICRQAA